MFLTTSSSGTESNIKPSVSAMRQQVYTCCNQQGRAIQSDPHNAVGILHVQSCLTHCWTSTSTALLRTLGEHGGTELLLHRGQSKKTCKQQEEKLQIERRGNEETMQKSRYLQHWSWNAEHSTLFQPLPGCDWNTKKVRWGLGLVISNYRTGNN